MADKHYTRRYESSPKLVVERMSFVIPGRSSVGVVGRTGAGKSTLALALLRVLEAHEGSLSIDGVDLSTVSQKQTNIPSINQSIDRSIYE